MRLFLAAVIALSLTMPAMAQDKGPPPTAGPDETLEQKPAAQKARPKPEITRYGDWFVGCQTVTVDGEKLKACEMQQILEETKSGKAFIRISLAYPRNSKKPVLRVFTPLGVLLQKGLVMKIDKRKPIIMPFRVCISKPPTCVIDGVMDKDIVAVMKRGNAGTLTLSFGQNKPISAPFSLKGFTKAINAIAPK